MYIAVMGYGTVGSGVVEVLHKNHDSIVSKSTQKDLESNISSISEIFPETRTKINLLRTSILF